MGLQHFERSVDFKPRSGRGDVEKNAASAPCAVDAHKIDGMLVFKANAIGFAGPPRHAFVPALA